MAQKRMFSLAVTDTDKFLDMSASAQALYFHLGMHGDDDGFVASPKKIARGVGCNDDDLRLLASKGYIIPFESGVIVIVDWNINNTLKNDRYHETIFAAERALVSEDSAGRWVLGFSMVLERKQLGSSLEPEHNITKLNRTKQNKEKAADKPPRAPRFTPPTVDEVRAYCQERGSSVDPEKFVDFYSANGWKQGRNKPIVDWKAAVRTWERSDAQQKAQDKNRVRTSAEYREEADFFG